MPQQIEPQKARPSDHVPKGDEWLHEVKFDGYRLVAYLAEGDVRLVTRRGNDWTSRFPAVAAALEKLPARQAILDGEVVALAPDGTSNFQQLQNAMKGRGQAQLAYFAFDLLYLDGYDLMPTPLERRKDALQALLGEPQADDVLQFSSHVHGEGEEFFSFACRNDQEGIICKKADGRYHQQRHRDWLKIKCLHRQEFVIGGFTEPQGSRTGFGALLLGLYDEAARLRYCGRVGTGFNQDDLARLADQLATLEQKASPFADPPDERDIHWTAPRLVAEVEFREWTDDGRLRQPSFQGLRDDKAPEEVRPETESPPAEWTPENDPPPARGPMVAGVTLSHPDRVLYPEQGLTKRDLAEYYAKVADWMLPHVVDRPLMLVRCPQGRDEACFHQKHAGSSLPDAVDSVAVTEDDGTRHLICLQDVQGLISLVQVGTLEFHPWGSLAQAPESPDRLIFDLDPDDAVSWATLVAAARDFRDVLATLGLTSFVRTTGGKGLHLVCPLSGAHEWPLVKAFAGAVAREFAGAAPDRYVATMSKRARTGRIFIDHFRNGRGATAVASYSTRARPGAPVATPLSWDELRPGMKRDHFTADRLPRRLGSLKRDPWGEFWQTEQRLTPAALRAMGVTS